MNREAKIDQILAKIDADAEAGWCSNWAETNEGRTVLTVTFADGTSKSYRIPAV
jgi:transcriptional regulatory protein LevR